MKEVQFAKSFAHHIKDKSAHKKNPQSFAKERKTALRGINGNVLINNIRSVSEI